MISQRHFIQLLFLVFFACFDNQAYQYQQCNTDNERAAIDKLRPLIAEYLVPDYMKTDVYHLRLLKAAKFHIESAVEIVKRTTEWRKYYNVDDILNEDLTEYFADIPIKLQGVDKEGTPIIQVYYGKWNLRKYALSDNQELWNVPVKVFIHALESAEQRLYEIQQSGRKIISTTHLLNDVDGFSLHEHVCPQCLAVSAELAKAYTHYPSFLNKSFNINAPGILTPVFQLVNVIVPSDVTQRMSFYTPNDNTWRTEILKDISEDELPKDFGGTQTNWYNKY